MGNEPIGVPEGLQASRSFKVHARMCWELLTLLSKVSTTVPEIEAARPGSAKGMDALCNLTNGIDKAKSLLLHCSESSKLYLALTGDAILARCIKSKDLMQQSLSSLQTMVPVMLSEKIYRICGELRSVAFRLDPFEEEAGNALKELLHTYSSSNDSAVESALQIATSRLYITSPKSLVIEKRCIRKLIDKFGENERSKRKILLLFSKLLSKYGKFITENTDISENKDGFPEVELHSTYRFEEAEINKFNTNVPPEEFICYISSKLMFDPVVIASGHTYEKASIQKWFDDGNDTCPKTNVKLDHLSFTSNNGMKELIRKWCAAQSVSVPVPNFRVQELKSWDVSMNSISSLSSSMHNLNLSSLDFSSLSLGSYQSSDVSFVSSAIDVKPMQEVNAEFLSKLSSLSMDSRRVVVEQLKEKMMPSEKSFEELRKFLKDARDFDGIEAQVTGCQLLSEILRRHRNTVTYMKEDDYDLIASFLDTEAASQGLSILEVLSLHKECNSDIKTSSALSGILNILKTQPHNLLESSLQILSNLSSNGDLCSFIPPSDFIPKLIPFLEDSVLATPSIAILKNLCDDSKARPYIADTEGCLSSIVQLLNSERHADQENATSILLSFCNQRVEYCNLVMEDGYIPLLNIQNKGSEKAKAFAMELLRILNGEPNIAPVKIIHEPEVVMMDFTEPHYEHRPPKAPGMFGKFFSKSSASSAKKKKPHT